MVRRFTWVMVLCVVLFAAWDTPSQAQMPDDGPEGPDMQEPGMGPDGPGGPGGPGGFAGRPGMRRPLKQRNPEEFKKMQAKREKAQGLRTTAEAHKNLADLYAKQDKIDLAVAELRKILTLADGYEAEEGPEEGRGEQNMSRKLSHVYMQIAELYTKADRIKDAEAALNEGSAKLQKTDLPGASRMMLFLGNLMQRQGKVEEAERAFKKVIELNAPAGK